MLRVSLNITQLLAAICRDGELLDERTCKLFLQVRDESNRAVERSLKHYDPNVILTVGFRVRSPHGVQFRRWAGRDVQRVEDFERDFVSLCFALVTGAGNTQL